MNLSLNDFLNKLPELVVDEMVFTRNQPDSEYGLRSGSWKLHKVGYKQYAVTPVQFGKWFSDKDCGSICISKISLGVKGVLVTLGDDYITPLNWD